MFAVGLNGIKRGEPLRRKALTTVETHGEVMALSVPFIICQFEAWQRHLLVQFTLQALHGHTFVLRLVFRGHGHLHGAHIRNVL